MTSDSQDSRRKHRRSTSDDDSPEDSKRHKYRHHRRHHRHHHRHSSKKRDEEKKKADEIEQESRGEREIVVVPPPADYDMEEGEIVEDGAPIIVDTDKKADSDVESGEFKVVEGQSEFDDSYTLVDDARESLITSSLPVADYGRKNSKNLKSPGSDSDDSGKYDSCHHHKGSSIIENDVDCGYSRKSRRAESRSPARSRSRSKSPSKGSSKKKASNENESKNWLDKMEVDKDEHEDRRNSSSHKVNEKRRKESSRSPSHGRYHLETSDKSILGDERSRIRRHSGRDEMLYGNGKVQYELDGERYSRRSIDFRLDGRETAKDKRRETSSSNLRSRNKDEDEDSWNRERDEMYGDKKKGKDQEISRERGERDHDRDRDWEREWDRIRGRDREREKGSDKDRGKARETKNDMDRNRERDMEKRKENDRGRSRDRDLERERRRDSSITTYRDRGMDKDRDGEMDRERDRNGARDRHRDRIRDIGDDRSRRHQRYDDGYGYRDRRHYDETDYRRDRDKKHDSEKDRGSQDDFMKESRNGVNRDDDDQDYQERVELELADREEDDIDRIKEESRRRREAILQKYKAKSLQQAVPENAQVPNLEPKGQHSQNLATTNVIQGNIDAKGNGQYASAVESIVPAGKSPPRNGSAGVKKVAAAGGLGEGTPKSERSNDIFCDDIFGDSPAGVRKTGKGDGLRIERSGLHDNWDDPEGYYSFRLGEVLDSRYEITAAHGKGVFSTVVRAKDLRPGPGDREEVAIKIIRNNETMLKAGTEELVILKKLVGADPDDRRHCVRYISHFKYRNHLCIVFESLNMNLRELLKKFGRDIGLNLTAVRAYAKQLFIALKHLRNCGVLHCDIKPDNMLVNESNTVLKLCDFGNAMFAGKNEITPYLVSRFYRAPEIILGLPYDHPMDIWSVGCCLYELFTGKVLFPGATNNDMLRLHMELKGPFPKKMLRKGGFIERHFDQDLNFLAIEEDPVSKKAIRRLIVNIRPKDIGTIMKGSRGSDEDPKMLTHFKDLLEKIFLLDPDKRLTVSQALNHPFITGK